MKIVAALLMFTVFAVVIGFTYFIIELVSRLLDR